MPVVLVQLLTQLTSFLTYNLNLPIPQLNFHKNQFGTFLLTNVSSMKGFHEVYAPMTNFTRSIATIVICTPEDKPVVRNGQVVVGHTLNMTITYDHRFLDGAAGSKMIEDIQDVWHNPSKYY